MKLTMKTYLVSLHLPKKDASDVDTWPAHRRVRASKATNAVKIVHREETAKFNRFTQEELDELGFESHEGIPNSFSARDFPIVEVKVVA